MQKVWLHDARRDAISGDLDFSFLRPRAPAAVHAFLPACPYIPFLLTNSPTFRLFHVPFAFEGLLLFLSADAPSFLPSFSDNSYIDSTTGSSLWTNNAAKMEDILFINLLTTIDHQSE